MLKVSIGLLEDSEKLSPLETYRIVDPQYRLRLTLLRVPEIEDGWLWDLFVNENGMRVAEVIFRAENELGLVNLGEGVYTITSGELHDRHHEYILSGVQTKRRSILLPCSPRGPHTPSVSPRNGTSDLRSRVKP
jgi:hypothetical protein